MAFCISFGLDTFRIAVFLLITIASSYKLLSLISVSQIFTAGMEVVGGLDSSMVDASNSSVLLDPSTFPNTIGELGQHLDNFTDLNYQSDGAMLMSNQVRAMEIVCRECRLWIEDMLVKVQLFCK